MLVLCFREQSTNGLYKAKYTDIKKSFFFFCHAEFVANPDIEQCFIFAFNSFFSIILIKCIFTQTV